MLGSWAIVSGTAESRESPMDSKVSFSGKQSKAAINSPVGRHRPAGPCSNARASAARSALTAKATYDLPTRIVGWTSSFNQKTSRDGEVRR